MRVARTGVMALVVWCCCLLPAFSAQNEAPSDSPKQAESETQIRQVLDDQVAAWNRGDVDGFMHGYKDSPDTTFIGKTVEHGYQPILERYRKGYSTPAAMGKLEFSELAVRMLGPSHAVVTGKFHLARSAAGGGDASGLFSLVFEKTPEGWRIILDHTSQS